MRVGIVGHEKAKFTKETEARARQIIREILAGATLGVSGRSPLGGIDVWAEEEAFILGVPFKPFPATTNRWDGPGGFKERNLKIAQHSDIVHCIVVAELPPTYTGRRFDYDYHCGPPDGPGCMEPHVKSGGCWTALQCPQRKWHVIR
jgi:hypothetical protein